jgi:hypothetical protein
MNNQVPDVTKCWDVTKSFFKTKIALVSFLPKGTVSPSSLYYLDVNIWKLKCLRSSEAEQSLENSRRPTKGEGSNKELKFALSEVFHLTVCWGVTKFDTNSQYLCWFLTHIRKINHTPSKLGTEYCNMEIQSKKKVDSSYIPTKILNRLKTKYQG